jgi:regulator of cell morphogenesis and NO signaling
MNHTATVAIPTADRAQQAIGQIAVNLPGSTAVFRRLKLDFCCGGQVPLQQACASKGLPLDAVLAELAELERPSELPATESPGALVDHILARYHAVHREQLPELIRMARRVEAVHRENPGVPVGLADLLENMEAELLGHMALEEQVLFPLLRSGGQGADSGPIQTMRDDHTSHGAQLERLMALTDDANPPRGACNTWRALYAGIAQLSDDLINHIHLENNVLFPQFEARVQTGCGSACGCA